MDKPNKKDKGKEKDKERAEISPEMLKTIEELVEINNIKKIRLSEVPITKKDR